MTDKQINLSPAEAQRMTRSIQALQKRLRDMHAQRDAINLALARVTPDKHSALLTTNSHRKPAALTRSMPLRYSKKNTTTS